MKLKLTAQKGSRKVKRGIFLSNSFEGRYLVQKKTDKGWESGSAGYEYFAMKRSILKLADRCSGRYRLWDKKKMEVVFES